MTAHMTATSSPAAAASPLTPGQRALLESELLARIRELDGRMAMHHGGATRAEHAQELLERDADDASQQAMDREVDLGLSDLEMRELDALGQALARLHGSGYGRCAGCGCEIPFDRLRVEPQAARCVACESALEYRQELLK
jgi:DnaK suppressor protein